MKERYGKEVKEKAPDDPTNEDLLEMKLESTYINKCVKETRTKTDLHIPLLRTSSGQKSFAYRGVCIWNNLTCETNTSRTFFVFKAKLKG